MFRYLFSIFSLVMLLQASGVKAQSNDEDYATKEGVVIPVVFHIVHGGGIENITDDQIFECMAQLNEDYNDRDRWRDQIIPEFKPIRANIGVEFRLARKDPNGNRTSGILRHYNPEWTVQTNNGSDIEMKQAYGWPRKNYLNIFVVRAAGDHAGSAWAYAIDNDLDGVVSSFWAVGRTREARPTHVKIMTHEVGHWFSLAHTFAGGCDNLDGVDDTPPSDVGQGCEHYEYPCKDEEGNKVLANRQNYMDYGQCTAMFTKGQKKKMWLYMFDNHPEMLEDDNKVKTGIEGEDLWADFYAQKNFTAVGNSVKYTDQSFVSGKKIKYWEWTFPGGEPSAYTGKNPPLVKYEYEGVYPAILKVTAEDGHEEVTVKENYMIVSSNIAMQNGEFEVSEAKFFDPGGKGLANKRGKYGNRTDALLVLKPKTEGKFVKVDFDSFELENKSNTDYLEVFDGADTTTLIGRFEMDRNPGTIISTHSSGALTFRFHSNMEGRAEGWEASVSLADSKPVAPIIRVYQSQKLAFAGDTLQFFDYSHPFPTKRKWAFEGGKSSDLKEKVASVIYEKEGEYSASLSLKSESGKSEWNDDFAVKIGADPIPMTESFGEEFPPRWWVISNPDKSVTWEQRKDAGLGGKGVLVMNNTDNSNMGTIDEIKTQYFDFSTVVDSIYITFDVAYTKFDDQSPDVLEVLVSKDFGKTWEAVYKKTHTDLETKAIDTNDSNDWIPTEKSDWRKESINVSKYQGEKAVQLKIRNTSGYGTRIWIDNLTIGSDQNGNATL
ncbi:M43 family zinc metalloprotease [Aureibacter tunicatorum]|uniref:PKD domain-containing protein n=1 Tax=Aureibacter tunicatorum TaxID=866807 RepID=A0AAE3XLZ5_9BACT|nr:M43 family zinc metalloprotease [Aureibacter tunicatorum]MDR6239043.1 hypothetical protein [Aureibacter tunicatorum]BDD05031.1 hypothetical protein AUTU_25140 [Aureibacter tunicatorum]